MSVVIATDDEWMEMSRNDDAMVAEMLLRLRNAVPPTRPSSALRLVWNVRQRRSGSRKDDDEQKNKKGQKGVESTRASPSTPLSFSAATSTSCGVGGEYPEESSSRPTRSKVSSLKVIRNPTKKTLKRVKKKKTLVELKVEEDHLLKERRSLKNELAILRQRVKKERVKNEIFKRKKLDLQQFGSAQVYSEVQNDQVMKVEKYETVCELPDLNLPFEHHHQYTCAAEAIYGTS